MVWELIVAIYLASIASIVYLICLRTEYISKWMEAKR